MPGSRAMQRGLQALGPHRGFELPGDEGRTVGQLFHNLANILPFVALAGKEDRIAHGQRRKALVNDPGEGADVGPHEIGLQLGGLMDRRCLGQRDDQHAGEGGIALLRQLRDPRLRECSRLPVECRPFPGPKNGNSTPRTWDDRLLRGKRATSQRPMLS